MSGAMTIAEGDLRFKVDVSVVFGGARSVATDELQYKIWSGSNDGERAERFKTNLHLAKFTL